MKKVISILILALTALFILPAQATPTPISTTLNLNTVIVGYTPDGPAPWLKATFTSETGSTTGTLTLTSLLTSTDFVQGANGVSGWAFYLDPAITSLGNISCTAGNCPDSTWISGINSGPIPGPFNLAFGWTSSDRFNGTDTATFTLTFDSALAGNPFIENSSGWSSYSHVQGIVGTQTCSGYIGSGSGTVDQSQLNGSCSATNVPEPTALGMFGFGTLLIGVFLGLRRRHRFTS